MALKKGIINIDGQEVEQYVLQNKEDVQKFFRANKNALLPSLKNSFINYVNGGETIILDTKTNRIGYYSWRTTGKENWNLLRLL
jgi:hypothetical protein